MKLPTQGASKAEIVFRMQEIKDEQYRLINVEKEMLSSAKCLALSPKWHILNNILLERYDTRFELIPTQERNALVTEYGLQLESETNNI